MLLESRYKLYALIGNDSVEQETGIASDGRQNNPRSLTSSIRVHKAIRVKVLYIGLSDVQYQVSPFYIAQLVPFYSKLSVLVNLKTDLLICYLKFIFMPSSSILSTYLFMVNHTRFSRLFQRQRSSVNLQYKQPFLRL